MIDWYYSSLNTQVTDIFARSEHWERAFVLLHAFSNSKMAETDVLEVEVDDRADFTEDTGEGTVLVVLVCELLFLY